MESNVDSIMNCLKAAAKKAVPSKTLKLKGPKKRASQEPLERIRKVKLTYKEWVTAGKPSSGQLYIENKLAKRALRSQQRVEEAASRKAFYNALMENPSTEMFYRLIRKSQTSKERSSCIVVDGVKYSDAASQRKCFLQYYEDLAVPKDNDYDYVVFLKLCNIRCDKIQSELSNSCKELSFSESDIEKSIDKLHSGKSPDEYGMSAEHFKAGKPGLVPVITKDWCPDTKKIPAVFKTGIITPVLKKGKYSKILENYRGITVRAIFGKLFEYTLLDKLEFAQSELQFDFTEGLSPAMADLLVSEAKAESQDNKRISTLPRFIAKRLSTLFITLFY